MSKYAPREYRVRKYVRHFKGSTTGLGCSCNEWEVRRGVKLVKRFDRRCDAYALLRELMGAQEA